MLESTDRRAPGWSERFFGSERIRSLLGFQLSALVHCCALILLALLSWEAEPAARQVSLVLGSEQADEELTTLDVTLERSSSREESTENSLSESMDPIETAREVNVPSPLAEPLTGAAASQAADAVREVPISDLLVVSTAPSGGGFEGRDAQSRARMVAKEGGTPRSERAVEWALKWFAAHQRQNGSWWLDHREACTGKCRHPGRGETTTGATSLALLPFLGAGYTHQTGPYQKVVGRGIEYLVGRMKRTQLGGDLREGSGYGMYSHGLSAIVLCEAYGMTYDEKLQEPAQAALDFICNAQHPGGGWRYKPGQPGDTTVTGWQVMALKSARMAQLHVCSEAVEGAEQFLNHVQDGQGAFYGYLSSGKSPSPTSVGLLLRMYLGWHRNDERLVRGVNYLSRRGPSEHDMYFNYYATQVLHHYGGNAWPQWNKRMRDYLVATQARKGHERGSWFFENRHGSVGGRHYTTAMCAMILEVYYRHMPLYGGDAVDFEL